MRVMNARLIVLLCGALLGAGAAHSQAPAPRSGGPGVSDYLLGAAVTSSEDTLGSEERRLRLRPLWSVQVGRFRLSTSRAAALWQLGREPFDPGLSTVLRSGERLSLSTSLQLDRGRKASSDPLFRGLPDVRDTVRGRLTARHALDEHWALRGVLSADLLGRGGGLLAIASVGHRRALSASTQLDLSASATWGSGTYVRTHYGISPEAATASGRMAYVPGSGWVSGQLGAEISTALSRRWVVFGGVGYTVMAGDARRSPLVSRRSTWSLSTGLAYRCC